MHAIAANSDGEGISSEQQILYVTISRNRPKCIFIKKKKRVKNHTLVHAHSTSKNFKS